MTEGGVVGLKTSKIRMTPFLEAPLVFLLHFGAPQEVFVFACKIHILYIYKRVFFYVRISGTFLLLICMENCWYGNIIQDS